MRFDHQLASAAANALRDAARQLQQVMSIDVPLGDRALAHWTGPHADQFRTLLGDQRKRTAPQLIDDLLNWARRIDSAGDAATALQAQHDRANQRWRDSQK
ncbi:MAG TPA: hypothetical protein VOB72_20410 [Candidatus Dormibacteraeota bacterium]|nr:hypothetical protein [Candidatus Dormibacteraeota bacterium]